MLAVRVTLTVGGRAVSVDELADPRLASTLRGAGRDIGERLAAIRCPVHRKTATEVRVHFDARGDADLQYASCCEALGKSIRKALASGR